MRAIGWMFAALSTIEPAVIEREAFVLTERDKPWFDDRMPMLVDRIRTRLAALSRRLGDADWLDGEFSAGDLMMVEVLVRPAAADLVAEHANLAAYVARGQARPAFARAFAAQKVVFDASQAAG